MGCQSSKTAGSASAFKAPSSPIASVSSPTILGQRTVDLPSVDVQVLKQENARREVMAAPELDLGHGVWPHPPHSPAGRTVLDDLAEVTQQVKNEQATASPAASAQEWSPSLVSGAASSPCPRGAERSGSRGRMDDTNMASPISAKSSPAPSDATAVCATPGARPAGCEPNLAGQLKLPVATQRRTRGPVCDWCSDDADGSVSPSNRKRPRGAEPGQQLECLLEELFRAHDLNSDGLLDEMELIKLNEAVAEVHDSRDGNIDRELVRRKYSCLFREKLDPDGRPVPYAIFRKYMLEMLDEIDRNEIAQEMIVEQFLCEARLARTVVTGEPLLMDRPRPGDCYGNACLRFCPAVEASNEVRA